MPGQFVAAGRAIILNKASDWLKKTLDYEFINGEFLSQALTHRSASAMNNERLEFLGDAVLDSVISELVYRQVPNGNEGELSRLRSALVKDTSLATLAGELGVGEHLILGPGEKKAGGHRRASILADALEAIFAAVYLDSGYASAAKVICSVFSERLENLPDPAELRDPKTRLQEALQAKKLHLPEYAVTATTGKAHKQTFSVSCAVAELNLQVSGEGSSRRDAEQTAAGNMLAKMEDIAR